MLLLWHKHRNIHLFEMQISNVFNINIILFKFLCTFQQKTPDLLNHHILISMLDWLLQSPEQSAQNSP